MRRTPAILAILFTLSFIGAVPRAVPRATPVPAPSATPVAAPAAAIPTVVVFPFGISSNIKTGSGEQAAQLFAQVMRQAGGLTVVNSGNGVARIDFQTSAKKLQADYYISGYMTLLGDSVSLVEQLVDVQSGVVIFARTAQIADVNDATAQAQAIHDTIIARETSFQASLSQAAAPASTPTPLPNNQANLGQLFKHRARAVVAPAVPAALKPAKGIFVARISGPLTGAELTAGTIALRSALGANFNVRTTSDGSADLPKGADKICGSNRDNTIATGTASTNSVKSGFFRKIQYAFDLRIYTCFGSVLSQTSGTGPSLAAAIASAVGAYVSAHPRNS